MKQLTPEVTKKAIADMTAFATNFIPTIDKLTLKKFLQLVNVDGAHGSITYQQFVDKVHMMIKYVPDTDTDSLVALADLLNLAPKPGQPTGMGMLAEPHLAPPSDSFQAVLN